MVTKIQILARNLVANLSLPTSFSIQVKEHDQRIQGKAPGKSREKIWKSREKKHIFASKSREKILRLLKAHPDFSAKKLADEIGITEKGVEKQLAKLKAEGLIKRDGPDKGGEWIVLD